MAPSALIQRMKITARIVFKLVAISLGILGVWPAGPAHAFRIEISDEVSGTGFYVTSTVTEANYLRYTGGIVAESVPPQPEFNRRAGIDFTRLSEGFHPVKGVSGKTGRLMMDMRPVGPLGVREGLAGLFGGLFIGSGTQNVNISGTFKVVPEGKEPKSGTANLTAAGLIEGRVHVAVPFFYFGDDPTASAEMSIFIEKLGTVTATQSVTGRTTVTSGLTGSVSGAFKPDGLEVGAGLQVAVSSQTTKEAQGRNAPLNFYGTGVVPINKPLRWNFILTLKAQNGGGIFVEGVSAANVFAMNQFVNLEATRRMDPFFSSSFLQFESATGDLRVVHPLSVIGTVETSRTQASDGTIGTPTLIDYSEFLPEIEAIQTPQLNFARPGQDSLLQALLQYSGIRLDHLNPDGTISFTNGRLEFLDPSDKTRLLARGNLVNILADPRRETFTASLEDFELITLAPGSSPLASSFVFGGGEIRLDPTIIFTSRNFTQSATSIGPFSVRGAPRIVVNDRVEFGPLRSTIEILPPTAECPAGSVGILKFTGRIRNRSSFSLSNLALLVTQLEEGNLLLNADGGSGGVGAKMTIPRKDGFIDGVLEPGETVDLPFVICLRTRNLFNFKMYVLGIVDGGS